MNTLAYAQQIRREKKFFVEQKKLIEDEEHEE